MGFQLVVCNRHLIYHDFYYKDLSKTVVCSLTNTSFMKSSERNYSFALTDIHVVVKNPFFTIYDVHFV